MISSLALNISGAEQIIDDVISTLPVITDPTVWTQDGLSTNKGTDVDINGDPLVGTFTVGAMINITLESDRDVIEDAINNVSGILVGCDVGSKIQLHTTNHDTDPPTPCFVETLWEVVP